jgi:glycosyltransferase involved in cell wall biosynthesis
MEHKVNRRSISFFVPTFNEANHIKNVLDKLSVLISELNLDCEIIVIDDCSTDNTLRIVTTFLNRHSDLNIKLIANSSNVGLGTNFYQAVKIAQKQYFRLINGDDVETMDSHVKLTSILGETDLIVPFYYRVMGRGIYRTILSKLYTLLLNLITGYRLQYYNGAPIYELNKLKNVITLNNSMSYSAETLIRFLNLRPTYQEIGLLGVHRSESNSMSINNIRGALMLFLRLFHVRFFT